MNSLKEMDLAYCDLCGNYVPTVEVEGDLLCAYEYAEYPDMANVVGQSMSVVTDKIQLDKKKKVGKKCIKSKL